jgi:small nuclear ribonucleoprotein (snRNP)-like protein
MIVVVTGGLVVVLIASSALLARRLDSLGDELGRSLDASLATSSAEGKKELQALAVECRRLQSVVEAGPGLGVVADLVKATVVVSLKSGSAFRGVLFEADDRALVLKNAEKSEAGKLIPVDGEVVVLRDDIDFLQRP